MSGTITKFTPGDIVVSETGEVDGTTGVGDNGASLLELVEINPNLPMGSNVVGTLILPQTTTTNGSGTTEYAVSGEYGSSSEGTLELAANGQSLVIAGYGVNAATYNTDEASGGNNAYGNTALAQTYSAEPSGSSYTLVPRVVADISANGTVDSSTAELTIYNTNNPRSVSTANGTTFYLSGQGVKGTTDQGLFSAADGSSSYTTLNTASDTRATEIYNGQLYVSIDSKQNPNGGGGSIDMVGTGLPTDAATLTPLPGVGPTVALTGSNGNGINGSSGTVYISPENFFFANSTTLYVTDGGDPKEGGVGDGGLQKWTLVGGTWQLDYTLTAGLTLVNSTTAGATSTGDSGLIGLTASVDQATGVVTLYATTEPLNDLGATGLYTITDTLADTTAAQAATESFTELLAGTAGSAGTTASASSFNIRGVAFAPTPACYVRGTRILTEAGEVAVEELAIGDRVITLDGTAKPIRWIGRRSYNGRNLAGRIHLLPILFRAGSLGENVPVRDLRVSPIHSMYLDGMLVPAFQLVNGVSITRQDGCQSVAYFHVELDEHDVIFAESAAAETFIDDDSRFIFENAPDYQPATEGLLDAPHFFAPRVECGYELEAIRIRLATRAQLLAA